MIHEADKPIFSTKKKSEQQIIWYGFIKEIIYKEKFILFFVNFIYMEQRDILFYY